MKIVRFGEAGRERLGIVDSNGGLRQAPGRLSGAGEVLDLELLNALAKLDPAHLPEVRGVVRLGCPIPNVGKFIGIGLNYKDHAAEANMPIPSEPVLFMKALSCIGGPTDPIVLPRGSEKTDWEVELGIVMGRTARYIGIERASDYIAGFTIVNDVSERAYQLERGGTWDKGKGCDSFGPVGPWLVTPDEVGDPQALGMWLDVNGTRRQTGHTSNMIFGVTHIVAYLSQFMTLQPGDLITTGTPPGVGMAQKPQPLYLKAGDVVELGIDGLGVQRQKIVGWSRTADSR